MARIDNLNNFLTDVAEAIRTKKETTDLISPNIFDTEIAGIETGGGDLSEYFTESITYGTSNQSGWEATIIKTPAYKFSGNNCSYMFKNYPCRNLDLSKINTSNVTNMSNMFLYADNLIELDVSNFNTSKVTDMSAMFYSCTNLIELDVSNFNTSNVTNMNNMFSYSGKLTDLDVSNFDVSKVTNVSGMFGNCSSLTSVILNKFNATKLTTANAMFNNCSAIKTIDISSLDFSLFNGVQNSVWALFTACTSLENLIFANNLGKGYTASANYSYAQLKLDECKKLTHDSLIDVMNKLYDLTANGKNTQKLILGTTNIEKLTQEEIAIATNKGWTVS